MTASLANCASCGATVAMSATACPACGAIVNVHGCSGCVFSGIIFLGLVGAFGGLWLWVCGVADLNMGFLLGGEAVIVIGTIKLLERLLKPRVK